MGKKFKIFEEIVKSAIGEPVHVLKDPDTGEEKIRVKKLDMSNYIDLGEQWCPHCHEEMIRDDSRGCYECLECGNEITDDDIEMGYGYPSYESTFEDDFG